MELKKNDHKLLGYTLDQRRTVGEISKVLGISPASVSIRIKKLKEEGLVSIERKGQGKKTYVRNIKGDKTKEYWIYLLKELKKRKSMGEKEFLALLPFDFSDPATQDKFSAPLKLFYTSPALVKRTIKITPEGEKFLDEHSNDRSTESSK